MGFLDELKKLTHPYDDDDDDFFGSASDDQPSTEEGAGAAERRSSFSRAARRPRRRAMAYRPRRARSRPSEYRSGSSAVWPTKPTPPKRRRSAAAGPLPRTRSPRCPWHLRLVSRTAPAWRTAFWRGKTILLNLEKASKVDARRLLDFMSGAAYALQGYVKRVSGSIYLVVPNGEEVTEADAMSQMETGGVFF